jgi:hypothetical protein
VQVNTVNVVLTVFVGEVVVVGAKPANVIVAPTANGGTTVDANDKVAISSATVKLVAVMLVDIVAEICGTVHTYEVPP